MKSSSMPRAALLLPLAFASVQAATQTVQVGGSGLVFVPNSVTAAQGDVVEFVIHRTHNVARSSFNTPCQPIGGSENIWSGTGLADGTIFSVTVNDTSPVWLYCATSGHCQDGMAMVINPPSSGDSLSAYQAAASTASDSTAPQTIAGGVYGTPGAAASTSAASGSSTTAAATTSATAMATSTTGAATSSRAPSSTGSSASATSTPNAARNVMADLMMVGGVVLGGAAMAL